MKLSAPISILLLAGMISVAASCKTAYQTTGVSPADEILFKQIGSAHIINMGSVYQMLGNYKYRPLNISFINK